MRFWRLHKGLVEIGDAANVVMQRYCQSDAEATEAGGVLLGRLILNTDDIIIDEATDPTDSDQRGRFFFKRAQRTTQQRIINAWTTSAGTQIYLGEWHTHPEDDPVPSRQDLRNWRRIMHSAKYEQEYLLFVIVGKQCTRIWEAGKASGAIQELLPVSEEHHV